MTSNIRSHTRSENFSADPKCMERLYRFLDELGSGGFGKVKLAIHTLTDEKVAIKIIDKKAIGRDLPRVTAELEALKHLAHQNICRMFQFVETEEKYYIVMEYCNGGEMFDYIVRKERLPESEARHFFRQLVQAVAYIHSMGFAHRDLKPENLLLTQDLQLKVIDFGLCAKPLNGLNRPLETCCGSPAYAAPELIQSQRYYGNEADIWSAGVLLYALLCGNLPFDDENYARLYKKIMQGVYHEPAFLSDQSKHFLRSMLTVDPRKRATIKEILVHPWLNKNYEQQIKWRSIYNREVVDDDVIRELAYYNGSTVQEMTARIKQWKFDYLTATYLILLQKKERKQNYSLLPRRGLSIPFIVEKQPARQAKLPNSPTIHGSLEYELDLSGIDDDSNSSSPDAPMTPKGKSGSEGPCMPSRTPISPKPVGRVVPRLESTPMELDKAAPNYVNNKENQLPSALRTHCLIGGSSSNEKNCEETPRPNKSVYVTPRRAPMPAGIFSPAIYRRPNSVDRSARPHVQAPNAVKNGQEQQRQVQFQQRSNSTDRPSSASGSCSSPIPSTERIARIDLRERDKSPGRLRQRVFSSLERKADKMINLLTPRKVRPDALKLKCMKTMVNVSVTSSSDPAKVRDELLSVLSKQGLICVQNGWKISGSRKAGNGQTTVELEVVAIENMEYVGVKRKRMQGDAFTYKRICEEVLHLSGL